MKTLISIYIVLLLLTGCSVTQEPHCSKKYSVTSTDSSVTDKGVGDTNSITSEVNQRTETHETCIQETHEYDYTTIIAIGGAITSILVGR